MLSEGTLAHIDGQYQLDLEDQGDRPDKPNSAATMGRPPLFCVGCLTKEV